jgi:hypothetical protein
MSVIWYLLAFGAGAFFMFLIFAPKDKPVLNPEQRPENMAQNGVGIAVY